MLIISSESTPAPSFPNWGDIPSGPCGVVYNLLISLGSLVCNLSLFDFYSSEGSSWSSSTPVSTISVAFFSFYSTCCYVAVFTAYSEVFPAVWPSPLIIAVLIAFWRAWSSIEVFLTTFEFWLIWVIFDFFYSLSRIIYSRLLSRWLFFEMSIALTVSGPPTINLSLLYCDLLTIFMILSDSRASFLWKSFDD